MENKRIVVLCPMDCEAEALLSALEDVSRSDIGGYAFFDGKIAGYPVSVVRCLMGSVNAAVCTAFAIEKYSPRCVILQGTAGAHNENLSKGDIVVAEKIVGINNYVSKSKEKGEGVFPLEWSDFGVQTYLAKSGKTEHIRCFHCDNNLLKIALDVPYNKGKVIAGTVGSGDVWNREADYIIHHRKTKGTDCEAMEGLGVAQICATFGIPMLEIRVISNCELNKSESFTKDTALCVQEFVTDYIKKLIEV